MTGVQTCALPISTVDIESESQKPDVEPERLVPGEYVGQITSVEQVFAQSGSPGYEVKFQCVSSPDTTPVVRGTLNQRFWLTEKAQRLGIIPLCKATGYLPSRGMFDRSQLVGQFLRLLVKYRKNQTGETGTWPEIDVFGWNGYHGMRPAQEQDDKFFGVLSTHNSSADSNNVDIPF